MVYSKEKWIASVKKAIADLKTDKPTSGTPCAVATLRFIRDGICDDIGDNNADDKAICETVRESINELIKALTAKDGKGAEDGFASNASAAAKAAGFKSTSQSLSELAE